MNAARLIGILVSCAGILLVWQARREVLFWLQEYTRLLRIKIRENSELHRAPVSSVARVPRGNKTLRLVSGFGLMILGQLIILFNLAF